MNPPILPMQLGDIFDRIFKLIGKTFTRSAMVAVVILLPVSLLMAFAMEMLFSNLADIIRETATQGTHGPEQVLSLIGPYLLFFASLSLQLLAVLACTIGVTTIASAEMMGSHSSWEEALRKTMGRRFFRALGQILLQFLAAIGLFMIPIFLFVMGKVSGWFVFLGVIALLICIPFIIKLVVQWYFAVTAIAIEDRGVFDSFDRSSFLVSGQWWRVLGIVILMALIIQFAISLVSAPINLIALWGFFSKYFQMIASMKIGKPDPLASAEMLESMGFGFGVVTALAQFLSVLVSPLVTTVLYFDLRARKGEFHQEPPEVIAPVEPII
ncbi:MAG: hypothetical protein HYR76_00880 [Ignavibacteria bacterium]|nr:hypothetical protein [Ignavibacteria bacterium]